jgi:hypothetical protein
MKTLVTQSAKRIATRVAFCCFVALASASSLFAQTFSASSTSLNFRTTPGTTTTESLVLFTRDSNRVIVHSVIAGGDAAMFSLYSSADTIWSNSFDSVSRAYKNVNFSPSAIGTFHSTLYLTDSVNTVLTIPLTGEGAWQPPVADSTALYLRCYVGDSVCGDITLYNPNPTGLFIIESIGLTGDHGSQLRLDSTASYDSIGAQRFQVIGHVCFWPTSAGAFYDSVIIHYLDPSGHEQTCYVRILLTGLINPNACIAITGDSSSYGSLDLGTSRTRTFHLANLHADSVTISSYTIQESYGQHYSVLNLPSLPMKLAASATLAFDVRFSAGSTYSSAADYAFINFNVDTGANSCGRLLSLLAYINQPPAISDTVTIYVNPDSSSALNLHYSGSNSLRTLVRLVNNSGNRTKVDGVALTQGTYLRVSVDTTLPVTLDTNAELDFFIYLTDTTRTSYDDTLLVTTEHGIVSTPYHIHATRGKAGVGAIASRESAMITVNPNPTQGAISIQTPGMKEADIQVLDILGRVVASSHVTSGIWKWNGTATSELANGTYIVRASGVSTNGVRTTLSQRFLLKK